jgi:hypothetical protein
MKSDIFRGSQTSAHLYEEADSAFRHLPEQSESIRAWTQAQEKWKACLPPDISALTRASQHFSSQLESIRKLADDQWGVHRSTLVAFQNSLKAAASLPPNILALSQASAKFNSSFEAISKKLAADQRFFAGYTVETVGESLESIGKRIQEDLNLTSAQPDLRWAAPVATDAEIREALTLQNVDVHTPALVR